MVSLWCGCIGLFLLRLVKHHGWEYVPLVLVAFVAWWLSEGHLSAGLADGALLTAIGGVHVLTRGHIRADRLTSER